ncbi:hypothetical protein DXA83_13205 [Bacteroides thetaiotaomicron]|nr:hypothetical protein DXA83_13205 [Bacteroides thetaiotaomicron]
MKSFAHKDNLYHKEKSSNIRQKRDIKRPFFAKCIIFQNFPLSHKGYLLLSTMNTRSISAGFYIYDINQNSTYPSIL